MVGKLDLGGEEEGQHPGGEAARHASQVGRAEAGDLRQPLAQGSLE